jgi:Flp pilus assembly protein TadG
MINLQTVLFPRRDRRRERGQVLPVVALAGTVLIGVTALAVDLSLQTSTRRQIQNVADTAALAGAHDLYSSGSTLGNSDEANAVIDALNPLAGNMGWNTDLPGAASPCNSYPTTAMSTFGLSGVCETVQFNNDTITVSTPPMSPRSLADVDTHDVEVDISQTDSTNFAAAVHFSSASEKGHAVARHGIGGVTSGFALFANQYAQTGNSISVVNGNVYAGRAIDLQAAGQAAFCANATTGNDDGYIFLGAPQAGDGLPPSQALGQANMKPTTSDKILPRSQYLSSACLPANMQSPNLLTSNLLGDVVQSGASVQPPFHSCPSIAGAGPAYYNSTVQACEVAPIALAPGPPPPTAGIVQTYGSPSGSGTGCKSNGPSCWKTKPGDGVYVVYHATSCINSCHDLEITQGMSLGNVTVWLMPGATFGVRINGGGGTVTWGGPFNAGTGQTGDDRYVVYGESGSSITVVGGGTTVDIAHGSIYMPGGTVTCADSTADLQLDSGQAVADTWNVSSGNHPNPQVTYNGAFAAVGAETFTLVE